MILLHALNLFLPFQILFQQQCWETKAKLEKNKTTKGSLPELVLYPRVGGEQQSDKKQSQAAQNISRPKDQTEKFSQAASFKNNAFMLCG